MLRAKRAIKALLEDGRVFVDLPTVEDPQALSNELARAGILAAMAETPKVDVRSLREAPAPIAEAVRDAYGSETDTVRNWETSRRELDTATHSYLRAISNDPENVEEAYAPTPSFGR